MASAGETSAVRWLPLSVFPAMELVAFVGALSLWRPHPGWALGLVGMAALALNFAVHVTFHEVVHSTGGGESRWLRWGSCGITLFLGIPFDGYRWHHYAHHRHDNAPGDYSCTWKRVAGALTPRRCLPYALAWPQQLLIGRADLQSKLKLGTAPLWIHHRINREKWTLVAWYLLLAFLSPISLGLYLLLTYTGWFLVTLHNYGQHLPVTKPGAFATSYQARWYNRLFLNNGIHYEHHAAPHLAWHRLDADPQAPWKVGLPHLAGPLFSLRESGIGAPGLELSGDGAS